MITTKNTIANELADILTDPDHADMWDDLYDWYGEVRDLEISEHSTIAELRGVGVDYTTEELVTALTVLRNAIEREIMEADKQAQWESRYWNERDYGGRL